MPRTLFYASSFASGGWVLDAQEELRHLSLPKLAAVGEKVRRTCFEKGPNPLWLTE